LLQGKRFVEDPHLEQLREEKLRQNHGYLSYAFSYLSLIILSGSKQLDIKDECNQVLSEASSINYLKLVACIF
jgi:hypothetical protein